MTPQPKKRLIDSFCADGSAKKVNEWLSCAYLLHSIAYNLYTDADELIEKHALRMGSLKHYSRLLSRAYDDYFNDFVPLIKESHQQAAYWHDLDSLQPVIVKAIRQICGFEGEENLDKAVTPLSCEEIMDTKEQNTEK